jgi:hypothetical protein
MDACDRNVVLLLDQIAVDECITKARAAARSPAVSLLAPKLDDLGLLPDHITVHLDSGCDSGTPATSWPAVACTDRSRKERAPIQASGRWQDGAHKRLLRPRRESLGVSAEDGCLTARTDALFELVDAVLWTGRLSRCRSCR